MRRAASRHGFTLPELLVVLLVIGTLVAIALPVFVGQRAKAEDAQAKSDARAMVVAVESCLVERREDGFGACAGEADSLDLGSGPGQVEARVDGTAFVVHAHSRSGNTFDVRREADGHESRTCDGTAEPGAGCAGGMW